jgi:hypothetical protein
MISTSVLFSLSFSLLSSDQTAMDESTSNI